MLVYVPSVDLNSPTTFNVVSTFAGGGGSSTGYRMAGGKVLLAVEWDNNAVETYRANYPDTPIFHGDINNLSVEKVFEITGLKPYELDILDGSPPCQGFSQAGKREYCDDRNQLFKQYVRLLRGLKPKVFVMENVSGMVKGDMKLIFAEILTELKQSGYKVTAKLLNAMYFGVPQSRERMIFIGVREDIGLNPVHPKPFTNPISVKEALVNCPVDNKYFLPEKMGLKLWKLCKPGENFSKYHPKKSYFSSTKLNPLKPSPTILKTVMPDGANGLFHWSEPRVLTISEIKRIGTFPDSYIFTGTFKDQWARIGNSVPPYLMKSIAETIYKEILSKI